MQTRPYQKKEKETHQNPKKQLKDDKQKVTKRHVKIIAKLAKRFQQQENIQKNIQENVNDESSFYIPYAEEIVNEILKLCCLNESQARKLLDLKHLNISADGSKFNVSGHQMYYDGYCKDRDRLKWRCPIRAKELRRIRILNVITLIVALRLLMVEWFTHIQQTIHVYILLLPEGHKGISL